MFLEFFSDELPVEDFGIIQKENFRFSEKSFVFQQIKNILKFIERGYSSGKFKYRDTQYISVLCTYIPGGGLNQQKS